MNGSRCSGSQLLTSRANLQTALTRRERKSLHTEQHGSCRTCRHDTIPWPPRCAKCINGGGKEDMFEPKPKKTRRRKTNAGNK